MISARLISLIVVGLAILIGLFDGIYIVDETEQVVITQFGEPTGEAVTTPGIKFKIPFVQDANYFEKRYLEWDGDRNQVPTKDKKFIFVPESIIDEHLVYIEELQMKGILHD